MDISLSDLFKGNGKGDSTSVFPFQGSAPQSGSSSEEKPIPKPKAKGFDLFYKQTDIKFAQRGPEQKARARLAEMEAHRKAKRTNVHMAKRGLGGGSGSTSSDVGGNSSLDTPGSCRWESSGSGSGSSDAERRKEMLQQWKKKRNDFKSVAGDKPVFKPGGSSNAVTNVRKGATGAVQAQAPPPAVLATATSRRNPAVNVGAKPPAVQQQKDSALPKERRVTRAMAKTNGIALEPHQNLKLHPSKGLKPPPPAPKKEVGKSARTPPLPPRPANGQAADKTLVKLKNLAIKEKTPNRRVSLPYPPPRKPDVAETSGDDTKENKSSVKKVKPRGLDNIYVEYNFKFAEASKQLSAHSNYWKGTLDNGIEIPEASKDDIMSVLGKAKLLLESKLPQFVELLYSYMYKYTDPCPILECDLQGWWDVAFIQVSAVCAEFDKLKKRQSEGWTSTSGSNSPTASASKQDKPVPNVAGVKKTPLKPKAQASKGIREFLALKRKQAVNPSNDIDDVQIMQ